MCVSEITMARLNFSNVLAHFSHSGVDDMADNTCHFGINSMFADGGVKPGHGRTRRGLYFPVDQHQFAACIKRIYGDPGLRFVFTTRAPVPDILDGDGKPLYQGKPFEPGKDYVVREAKAGGGYVVAIGRGRLSRAGCRNHVAGKRQSSRSDQQADIECRRSGDDEDASGRAVCAGGRGWNVKTGLGSRFGSYLLQAGFKGKYNHIGTHQGRCGGLWQQMGHQGLDSAGIQAAIKALL